MMKRGMLIDIEHMSQRSTDQTLQIAEQAKYPVMLSHAWFRHLELRREELETETPDTETNWNEQRSEIDSSAETLV